MQDTVNKLISRLHRLGEDSSQAAPAQVVSGAGGGLQLVPAQVVSGAAGVYTCAALKGDRTASSWTLENCRTLDPTLSLSAGTKVFLLLGEGARWILSGSSGPVTQNITSFDGSFINNCGFTAG